MRLRDAARICAPRPDLVVAVGWQLHCRYPALPIVFVLWLFKLGTSPGGAVVDGDIHLSYFKIAGPGRATQIQFPGASRQLGAIRRAGNDRAYRHRLQILEVLHVWLFARDHWLDGDAVRGLTHAGAIVILVADPNAVEPLRRHRARPARNHPAHRKAVNVWQRLSVHCPYDQIILIHQLLDWDAA